MCEEHVPPELNKVRYQNCCEEFVSRQVFPEMILKYLHIWLIL